MKKPLLLLVLILTAMCLRAVDISPVTTAVSATKSAQAQTATAPQLQPTTYSPPQYAYGEDNRGDPLI